MENERKLTLPPALVDRLKELKVEPVHTVGIFLVDHGNDDGKCTVMVFHDPEIGEEDWSSIDDVPVAYATGQLILDYIARLSGEDVAEDFMEPTSTGGEQLDLDLSLTEWTPPTGKGN